MTSGEQGSGAEELEYYFPNKMGRISLLALEEVMGRNGVTALLNLVNLRHLLGNYPPDNFEKGFSFSELSRLLGALDEMYGSRGGRDLALRTGRAAFRLGIRDFGPMLGIADLVFRVMPLTTKLKIGFEIFTEAFNKVSDHQVRLGENEDHFIWSAERCGICWGRTSSTPCCHLAVGILQEALYWVSGGQSFHVEEVSCIAAGDETCTIWIDKQPVD
jgi:predicted hydrocarbon binding protein